MKTTLLVTSLLAVYAGAFAAASPNAERYASEWPELSRRLDSYRGVYKAPAKDMANFSADGPFMGNGNIYGILTGDAETQTFTFDHSDMWTDDGGKQKGNSGYKGVRAIPFGGLRITSESAKETGAFSREHDILNAEIVASSKGGFKTRSWVAAEKNVVVTELWTEESTPLPVKVTVWAKDDERDFPTASGTASGVFWATRSTFDRQGVRWVTRVAMATRILGATPVITTDTTGSATAALTLVPGKPVRVISVIAGGKDSKTSLVDAQRAVYALNDASVEALRREHRNWWKNFWVKSYLLTDDPVLEKPYYGALYLYACTNRARFTPVGQYPFCLTDNPGWRGDYHLNQEYLGQNCSLFACNRPELAGGACRPLFDFVPYGRKFAARNKNHEGKSQRGIMFPVGLAPWGIPTEDFLGDQVTNAAFTGTLIAWEYDYYRDKDWLRTKAYPFFRELAEFWEGNLVLENGRYVSYGATHEHAGARNSVMDIGLARFVLRKASDYSVELGVDAEKRPVWKNLLDKLSDYPTREINGVTNFVSDENPRHACLCRCEAAHIYPAEQVNMASPKDQLEMAHRLIAAFKPSHYEFPVCAVAGTRVGYPIDKIVDNLKRGLINANIGYWNGMRANGTFGGNHYNGAYMEFMQSSMLQTDEAGVRIFPNWFRDRPVKFARLRAKGAFVVSAEQDAHGKILPVTIVSEKGEACPVVNPWPGKIVRVTRNGMPAGTVGGDRFTLKTAPGETIVLRGE